jgi:hypothetical protein
MPSFRVGGIWVLKIEKFLSYALIFILKKLAILDLKGYKSLLIEIQCIFQV